MLPAAPIPKPVTRPAVYNPLLPGFKENPHPFLHELRSRDPVHWSPVFQIWVLTRYADVLAALKDERLSANARNWDGYRKFFMRDRDTSVPAQVYQNWMLQLDPPDHTRLRALVSKAFTPRVVEAMRPRVVEMVNDLLDRVEGRDEMDVIRDLAYPLPVMVIAKMLGASASDHERIKKWSSDLLPSFSPSMSADAFKSVSKSAGEFSEYFKALIEDRRKSPGTELIDGLIAARDGSSRLSDDELLSTCLLLVVAGHLTTVQLIGRGVQLLLEAPDQMEKLRARPELMAGAVEEILRLTTPLQVVSRPAMEDLQLGARTVRKGQLVLLSMAAANRDPEQFPDPDRLDIARAPNRHLAFGYGDHFCAGAPLARLEAQVAIGELLRRRPVLEPGHSSKLEVEPSLTLRGLKNLPVRFRKDVA